MFAPVLEKLSGLVKKQIERTQPLEDGSPAPNRVSINPCLSSHELTIPRLSLPVEAFVVTTMSSAT